MDDMARNLRAAAAVLLEAPEHVPIRGGEVMLNLHKRADEMNAAAGEIERLRLTPAEREAIEEAMRQVVESDCIATPHALEVIATLRGLLERTR